MTDLPDEVLIDRRMHAWRPENWHLLGRREGQVRYVRGDLYEQVQADCETLGAHLERTQARAREMESKVADRRALTQWVVDVEAERDRLQAALAEIEAERDALRQQAEIWAQEARTQRATVHECYQACTGATGEPGDWHGAEPVRAVVAKLDRLRSALADIAADPYDYQRVQDKAQEALSHD